MKEETKRRCNFHDDCDRADAEEQAKNHRPAEHCNDPLCAICTVDPMPVHQ